MSATCRHQEFHAGTRPLVTNVQSSTAKVSYQGYAFMTTFEFLRREPDIRDYKKGQTVFKQGDPGSDCMFGVVEGSVDIQIGAETLERVHPTHVFGEMALIDQRPRSATAIAAVDSRIAVINKKRFLHLVEATPHFALSMMQVITERLRRASAP
jgi:CRP/FNR family cyclic AMP-dependent transcriptional regulator